MPSIHTQHFWDYIKTDTYLNLLRKIQVFFSGLVIVTATERCVGELAEFECDTSGINIKDN
jgi:hypothetical protein